MAQAQAWQVPISPAERFQLIGLALGKGVPEVSSVSAGRSLRRAIEAFGLNVIRAGLFEGGNKVSAKLANDRIHRLHTITAENLDVALDQWAKMPRTIDVEMEIGALLDRLDQIKAAPDAWVAPVGEPYVPEDWSPPKQAAPAEPQALTCPSCKQTFDLAEAVKK